MNKLYSLIFIGFVTFSCTKKTDKIIVKRVDKSDSITIKKKINTALNNGQCYEWLSALSNDIALLKPETISLFGYKTDSQRYFDYHHATNDAFDKVNKRELELGATAMTSLIYLLDKNL